MSRAACSFAAGLSAGALLGVSMVNMFPLLATVNVQKAIATPASAHEGVAFTTRTSATGTHAGIGAVPRHLNINGRRNRTRRRHLPAAGDLSNSSSLAAALAVRASDEGEFIFMLTDAHHMRLALNLLLNLDELGLHHHMVIASSAKVCDALLARARHTAVGGSLGCGYSSFLHPGWSPRIDAGLEAYGIDDSHPYLLWWQRFFILSNAIGLGYRVLALDTDISLRADPYPLLRGPLGHHSLVTGLDNDRDRSPFVFPNTNVGFVYARGPPKSAAHWVLAETRRRFERLLRGEIFPLPSVRGMSQQQGVVWEQDTVRDVLETAAFTPAAPSYRRAQAHCAARTAGIVASRSYVPKLPSYMKLRIEQVRFFPQNRSRPPMPSAWLPLHLPVTSEAAFSFSSMSPAGPNASAGCNGSDVGGKLFSIWDGLEAKPQLGSATPDGSYSALPLWIFSSYLSCPHGATCDGRWGRRPPPILMGHLVGSITKLWVLRLFGWWHYDAGRLPPTPGGGDKANPVYPAHEVRPLVLRGHSLVLGRTVDSLRRLQHQLLRWTLLAIALGRRAVIPLVPCSHPTPDVPVDLNFISVLIKMADSTACGADARAPSWRLPPTVPIEPSHERLTATTEMDRMIRYGLRKEPPAASCCQLIPEVKCIDRFGDRGELKDELMLCERDLGWIDAEEEGERHTPRVFSLAGGQSRAELAALQAHSDARTLVIDLGSNTSNNDDLEDVLPLHIDVEAAVRARIKRGEFVKNRGRWQLPSRRCVERLLDLAAKGRVS
jgi:hypothetical protein